MSNVTDTGNRTLICSVVFVDLVAYTKKSVTEQIAIKDRFTTLLSEGLKDIPAEQRIVLDTGDGAAISFLGDPEDALFVAMHMRDSLKRAATENATEEDSSKPAITHDILRIGINLGPVRLVRDINNQPNIIGDGINVAQRIMSFATPGQIVTSRSYYDVVSCMSDAYAKLFQYEGSRTDKHVREHEIYVVGESDDAFNQAKSGMEDRAASTNPKPKTKAPSAAAANIKKAMNDAGATGKTMLQDRKMLMIASGALGVVVLGLLIAVMMKRTATEPLPEAPKVDVAATAPPSATDSKPADPTAPAVAPTAPPTAPVAGTTAVAPAATTTAPAATPLDASKAAPKADAAASAKAPDATQAATDAAKALEAAKLAEAAKIVPGTIAFSVQPWGEVFINGKSIGVTPPLKSTKLAPGKYKLEVKNTTFPPYSSNIEIKTKEELSIKHKFQ